MDQWRERVVGPARDDFDLLFTTVLPSAESSLRRFGRLQPFGAAMTTQGDLVRLTADPRLGQDPPARDVVAGIYGNARASAFARRSIAVVQTGRSAGGSAMRIDMEHKDGQTVSVVVAYTLSRFRKTYTRGKVTAGPCERRVWQDVPDSIDLRTATEVTAAETVTIAEEAPIRDVWSDELTKG